MIGLEVDRNAIDRHLFNERYHIQEAAYRILMEWRVKQQSSKVAHTVLCDALKKVEMSSFMPA